jgi:SPP1 gp7 family putative phage head morphogenesis protein
MRDAEWFVCEAKTAADGGWVLFVRGLTAPVSAKKAAFWTSAEKRDSIAVLLPENVDLRPDRSARARDTRLKIEAMLRNRPVVGEPVAVGHRAAMDLLPFQLVPAQTVLRGDRDTQATRKRAETVLRTNGFQAYAAARYRQQKAGADIFPYWKYVTMDDGRVRDRHAEFDGVILPADDPFWKDHYPPWDFNCRCIVIEMDEETAREEAAAGEGSMWDQGMRDKWAADHAGMDAARQFHFRPDSLEMDLRDLARAEGRTPAAMKEFGQLMETRQIGTGEIAADGVEKTTTVREWLWKPLRAEYQSKAVAAGGEAERAWTLDAWTGEELATTVGTRASVRVPDIPAGREVVVIHSHAAGSAALSPRDALAATKPGIEGIEAVTFGGDWQRVKAQARSPQMQAMLQEWAAKHDASKRAKDPAVPRKFLEEWRKWFKARQRLGYLKLDQGRLS